MNILILSRNKNLYSTKRLLKESNKLSHDTSIIDYMHCNIINERNSRLWRFLIKDRKHADEIIKIHQSANKKFIFQEFIQESKGADIRAFVVGNEVVGAMKRQAKAGVFRSNLHQSGKGINIELSSQETKTALNAAKAMGLGVAGVDMLQSDRGPLVIEVNASPGLEGIEKTTKISIAHKIIKHIEKII